MERTATAGTTAAPNAPGAPHGTASPAVPPPPYDACLPAVSGLLDAMPRQRGQGPRSAPPQDPVRVARDRSLRPWRLLPTPTGTPFTFGYAAVLTVTSLITEYADPALVHTLHQASSTDVAHLVQTPALVLVASALWIAGGILSPFAIGFLLVLTALERRIGGARTACVFLLGHVLATLATEVPVGLAVLVGHLPDSSLHRLDYGVSFGVAAGVGALAGLLTPWLRRPLLAAFGGMLTLDLLAFTDPMTDWGHLVAFAIGIATWPWVRRWAGAWPLRDPVPDGA
ncbi:rhomboid-like protein [Streptomyces sp. NPDC002838]|uniref:rhomboid-like protein n=1 Tax=Streptomyces sp. NPDC002838 TaxID=3154436 RepID=UPI00331C4300